MGVGRKISLGTCNPEAASYKSAWVFSWSVWWCWKADYGCRLWVWEREILLLLPIPLPRRTNRSEQQIIVSVKNDEFVVLFSPSLSVKPADLALDIGNWKQTTTNITGLFLFAIWGFRCENARWWRSCAFHISFPVAWGLEGIFL